MKRKLNENTPAAPVPGAPDPAAAAAPVAATKTVNIGQQFSQAKTTVTGFLKKLGEAFNEYEDRMKRLNMALQRQIAPLTGAAGAATERIGQLEQEFAELQRTSAEDLRKANETIADLRRQLRDAKSTGDTAGEQLRLAQQELQAAEQTIQDKQTAIEGYIEKLGKAKDRLRAAAQAHDQDRQSWNQEMDDYEATVQKLKREKEELRKLAEEATSRFNELLGGVQQQVPDPAAAAAATVQQSHTKHYGGFDLMEHLKRARKKQGVTETWF